MADKVYAATENFATEVEGRMRVVSEGETFADGHPVVKAHPGAFSVVAAQNEAPKAKPKQKRKRRKSSGR